MVLFVSAWDNETIDHWHNEGFKEGDMPQPLAEESSFATLFPKYREKYLQKVWPHVTRILKGHVSMGIGGVVPTREDTRVGGWV